jgi:hypothetical protein
MRNNSNNRYYKIKNSFFRLERNIPCVLYEPVHPDEKSQTAVLVIHSHIDSLTHSAGDELAKRGYRVMCASISVPENPLDQKLPEVSVAVEYLRDSVGVQKVITLGHSGGATLMSAYQAVAENGAKVFQGSEKLIKCTDLGKLIPADGVMLIDSNYGNGAMTLLSIDPAVTSEDSGMNLDPKLDLFNPSNGFKPGGSTYSEEFIRRFQKAQGERNNRIIDFAVERLNAIERGKGKYDDDEPLIIPSGVLNSWNNKLFPQDIRLLSRTQKAWPLIHGDGSVTNQIIPCVRAAKNDISFTASALGTLKTTVRTYLNCFAVRTTDEYSYGEDSIQGIDWSSSYSCTPGNVKFISTPLLVMGMTAGYEFLAAEIIYENAEKCADKTIAFVEGADHVYQTAKDCEEYPGQFGDTVKTTYDYIDKWLIQEGRF